ncbi:MAG: glycosyltransferase family 2 protein [Pseudomonadota bacterium]
MPSSESSPRVSIVIPMKNEEGNIVPLFAEIEGALSQHVPFEIIAVNDGSDDGTANILASQQQSKSYVRVVMHRESCGKSAALRTGIRASQALIIATLDGDGQNNPAFLPVMIEMLMNDPQLGLVQAERKGRKDTAFKRWQSRMANHIRTRLLKDKTMDTNCGMKVFRRDAYWELPYFDGLHRFMPALIRRCGLNVAGVEVVDRPRMSGISKYGFFDRLWVGILDLFGVWWLIKRNPKMPDVVK